MYNHNPEESIMSILKLNVLINFIIFAVPTTALQFKRILHNFENIDFNFRLVFESKKDCKKLRNYLKSCGNQT